MKRVAILGSTGSVGTQALDLIRERRDAFEVVALSAGRREADLCRQVEEFSPSAACLVMGGSRPSALRAETAWFEGANGILEALEASRPDVVLNAITGAAGLPASEWTLRRGCNLALANKESLVVAGELLMALAAETGARILPVDSEHCAVFQCLDREEARAVRKVYLTASGGPFRSRPIATFEDVTVEEALAHPTWDMGPRISIGSATMMNKAFEVLEARWLFDLEPAQIDVVIHPQSIVHSMVEFIDGSMLAQLGLPDMRVPILYCLGWPERLPFDFSPFDVKRFRSLEFLPVEPDRFPAVPLAFDVLRRGGDSGAVFNAADEELTGRFLRNEVPFPAIVSGVAEVLRQRDPQPIPTLDAVITADRRARAAARALPPRSQTPPSP